MDNLITNVILDLDFSNIYEKYIWDKYDFIVILLPMNEIDLRNFPEKGILLFFPIKFDGSLNLDEMLTFINYLLGLVGKILLIDSTGQRALFFSLSYYWIKYKTENEYKKIIENYSTTLCDHLHNKFEAFKLKK